MNPTTIAILQLTGGLAFFLFGMELSAQYLQESAQKRLKAALTRITTNRFSGMLVGIVVTFLTSSSSATSVILVSLVSAAIITLPQAIGVVLGAHIGTTITVQIIAFKISQWALAMIAVGFLVRMVAKRPVLRTAGSLALSFGLIFYGMELMSLAMVPLRAHPFFLKIFEYTHADFWPAFFAGLVITSIIQSSGATIGILMAIAQAGGLLLPAALGFVLGANIGTCVTALLAAVHAPAEGKQLAIAQILFKAVGAVIAVLLIKEFVAATVLTASLETLRDPWASLTAGRQTGWHQEATARLIANGHMIFNIFNTALFLVLMRPLAAVARWIHPSPQAPFHFEPKFLTMQPEESPALALHGVKQEIERMALVVDGMLVQTIEVFFAADLELRERILAQDDKVDYLRTTIAEYLSQIARQNLDPDSSFKVLQYYNVTGDLEHMGDIVVKNLMENAAKKIYKDRHFTPADRTDLAEFHTEVLSTFRKTIEAFRADNPAQAEELVAERRRLRNLETECRRRHIERLLARPDHDAMHASNIYLDVLSNLERVGVHAVNVCRAVTGKV